ncbi:cyclase family protein [Xenorhabdus hominickii]|uniref:Cyclase n=1 Tax=Xenorhabdus hominickii TaxID=351679 RepID=A0A2G0Q642_XENHO|nr:cyclase family protein [Xenorhabdus hominickii]AOM39536.1 cyclase [Xenorhabdus hominickii]PHM54690.1 cyclase [Xenorhabdus hominickii]
MMNDILQALTLLKSQKWVDLTHSFDKDSPHFFMFDPAEFKTLFHYKDGFFAQKFTFPGQYGTHIDAPCHFIPYARTLDELELKELVLPLIVIDQSERAKRDPNFSLSKDDILQFEAEQGVIESETFVALRTDWSKRWPSQQKMDNKDKQGNNQTPGWRMDALKFLFEERKIKAIGHETFDTDSSKDFRKNKALLGEHYVLSQNTYQIELLANLDQVPIRGAVIFNIAAKPKNAPGFPVRSFAIVP